MKTLKDMRSGLWQLYVALVILGLLALMLFLAGCSAAKSVGRTVGRITGLPAGSLFAPHDTAQGTAPAPASSSDPGDLRADAMPTSDTTAPAPAPSNPYQSALRQRRSELLSEILAGSAQ